jgi:protein phosphatase 2C family protein 2/3
MVTSFPDVVVKPFHKDVEFMILACDGIWDCKSSEEVVAYMRQELPIHGQSIKDIQNITHNLLDDLCPNTFEEMRNNDGIGSDNMTIIILDFLQNSGGANLKISGTNKTTKPADKGAYGKIGRK